MQRPARNANGYKSWASRYRNSKTESRKQKLENRNRSANGYKSWASRIEKLENTPKEPQKLMYGRHGKIRPSSEGG